MGSLSGKVAVVTGASRGIGEGIAVQVDHARDDQVEALFDQLRHEQGRRDILVNNAVVLPEDLTEPKSFWDTPLSNGEMVDVGVRSNFAAAWHAAQIMVPQRAGLIVAISGYVGVTCTYGAESPGRVIAALANDPDVDMALDQCPDCGGTMSRACRVLSANFTRWCAQVRGRCRHAGQSTD